jgi:outer membrane receptor for ferrienterochelin and colicin
LRIIFIFLISISYLQAQNRQEDSLLVDSLELHDLLDLKQTSDGSDLEKELDQKIESSSAKKFSLRNSPNVISVITEEEIRNSGAKDLLEVLYYFNSVDFNVDVQGYIGFNYRGLPANEGKIQILLDGFEINEMGYNSFFLGGEFDLSLVKKIELVKGSGSAVYGGNASFCVLNIITKLLEKSNDLSVQTMGGLSSKGISNYGASANFTRLINKKLFVGLQGALSKNYRTNRPYTDAFGTTKDISDSTFQKAYYLNGSLSYKRFSFTSLLNVYKTFQIDNFDKIEVKFFNSDMLNFANKLNYNWDINKKHNLNFSVSQRHNRPYYGPFTEINLDSVYHTDLNRYNGKVVYNFYYGNWFNFTSLNDYLYEIDFNRVDFFSDSTKVKTYRNLSSYEELSFKTKFVNIIGGVRFNNHSVVGNVIVPRISFLKKINNFNYKLIYSKGYRLPSLENFNTAVGKIEAENTNTYDFELGYQFSSKLYASANYFNLTTLNPIVYQADGVTGFEQSQNTKAAGTQGFEADVKWKDKWAYVTLKYQYITNAGQPVNERYTDQSLDNINLATTRHKLSLYSNFELSKSVSIAPSLTFLGERFAYFKLDTLPNALQRIDPQFLANVYVHFNHFLDSRFSFSAGIVNMLNQKILFPQGYRGDHAPLPGMGREFRLKLSYNFQ